MIRVRNKRIIILFFFFFFFFWGDLHYLQAPLKILYIEDPMRKIEGTLVSLGALFLQFEGTLSPPCMMYVYVHVHVYIEALL